MAAGQAQRVFDANPTRRVAILDRHEQPRWHPLWLHNPIIAPPIAVAKREPVTSIRNAPGCRPYLQYPFTYNTGWRFTDWRADEHRGRLYFDARELAQRDRFAAALGRPYVVIEPSPSADGNVNKSWIFERWQAVVDARPDLTFVQLLHPDARRLARTVGWLSPSFRDGCAILSGARAFLGTEGGLHHAAAALRIPAVVIFGGCASVRTTGYADHLNLADASLETPCGRYRPCPHCREAMASISVPRVVSSLRTLLQEKEEER